MVAWESNPTAEFLIADMGPYIGSDWPPVAPPLTGMFPADAGEIDYYVLDPAVDDYLTMGFSPTGPAWSDSYVYTSWSLIFGAYTDGSSSGPPSGAHIYVVWYDTSYSTVPGPPSVTPESLIPSSYSALGMLAPPPPPPPPTPDLYGVYGGFPGSGFMGNVLGLGLDVSISGGDLDIVTSIKLPGIEIPAADFYTHTSSTIGFTLPDDPGIRGGPLRAYADTTYDEVAVDVLKPEAGWRTPDPRSVIGSSTRVDTDASPVLPGRYKTVGSSRVGDGGDPSYIDDSYPPAKMGWDNGTILEQITVVGINGGYYGIDGSEVIPPAANLPGVYPPDPPGATVWLFEYQDQPYGQQFSAQSPVGLMDALIGSIQMYAAFTPTYGSPRLTDPAFEVYAVPPGMITDTETPGYPDVHITKPQSWFASPWVIASGMGPNFHGDWNDGFEDADVSDWIGVSSTLSPSPGFSGGGLRATGAGEFRSPPVGATPTFNYRMDCWIGDAPAAGGHVRVGIAWLDAGGTQVDITWGGWFDVAVGAFDEITWITATAPDNAAVWSRQLVFQFTGCASLQIDSVHFRYDSGVVYQVILDLPIPADMLYVASDGNLFMTLIGVTDPGIYGTEETGALAYAMEGASATEETGIFQPRVTYQPSNWRYWLPLPHGEIGDVVGVGGWSLGGLGWG